MGEEDNKQPEKPIEQIMAETEAAVERVKEQERTTVRKEKFLKHFEESFGIIGYAAQCAGITRKTYYEWMERDPEFKAKVDEIKFYQPEVVEDKLIQLISKNHPGSIHFYLRSKHQEYKPKQELSGGLMLTPYEHLTTEQLIEQAEELRRRRLAETEAGGNSEPGNGEEPGTGQGSQEGV